MTDVAPTEAADFYRIGASVKLDSTRRVALGKYVTPIQISWFMASLFSATREDLRVLDAGAGVGSLATAQRLRDGGEMVPVIARSFCNGPGRYPGAKKSAVYGASRMGL
ncbi:MAG: hypothetical protein OXH46_15235 [Gemmatimonadetes bacterium]|nr:hypothetical protein [Gemmatimonadota bacterium]